MSTAGDFQATTDAPLRRNHYLWLPVSWFESSTGWTAFGNDTLNITTDVQHIVGTKSLEFDKVNGAANTATAGISRTVTSVNLSCFQPTDILFFAVQMSALTDVASIAVRLGTSASHYNVWTVADQYLTAARFSQCAIMLGDGVSVGNGWTPTAVTYAAVSVTFDGEDDALQDIFWDHIGIISTDPVVAMHKQILPIYTDDIGP